MKKILLSLIISLFFFNIGFAESYYFKDCKLSSNLSGDYLINFDKNIIKVKLKKVSDGSIIERTEKIEIVTKNEIITERKQNINNKAYYFKHYFNNKSESVSIQKYKRETGIDLIRPDGPKAQSFCIDVKADWDKSKIEDAEISKEQKQILKVQEEILKEQSDLLKCKGNDYKQWSNCKGAYQTENGYKYDGQFKNGKMIEGTAIYPGGAKYVGKFKNDQPHGQGIFTYPDGSQYYGDWKDGKNHGIGTKAWKDGKKYTGQFKNDQIHGKGTFTYPDGTKYVGQYQNGKRHGQGTLKYSDGRTYIGEFVAGLEHGKGTCINLDGSSVDCRMLKMKNKDATDRKNRREISIEAKKWVKLPEYDSVSGKAKVIIDNLEDNFTAKAFELCSSSGNFDVLEKRIDILEIDETPAFGIDPVIKLVINGVIECKS